MRIIVRDSNNKVEKFRSDWIKIVNGNHPGVRRCRDLGEFILLGVVGPLRMALSQRRNVRWGNNGHLRVHTVVENAHSTSPPAHPHYTKRQGRQNAKCRFSTRNHHPSYKSRGCVMPGAGFRAAICSGCTYSVLGRRVHRFIGLRTLFLGQAHVGGLQHATVRLVPLAF